ncbi:hypothetical protein K450DRAFT_231244 [Umbelopsis ramanniana AG]|uniref:Uncharacterized protein n=1 Tax=Umbelopsis ramanniana AG TaxID=1314678 RepID=A0AAD5EDB7_UMBRA|nr:uncharacterized protein K450DRAFT_231244 [Umbelopsis ramanniana AG]KAI8581803.1 hypothetical protein K450DRAFT_231244 [Umbelopsis ramanniana AG]
MTTLTGNLDPVTPRNHSILNSRCSKDPSPRSNMPPSSLSSSTHLHKPHKALPSIPSSIDIPLDLPTTPSIPSDEQVDTITDKILHLNVNDIEHGHSAAIIHPGCPTLSDVLSRPFHNDDVIVDYSATPMTHKWSALDNQPISFHSEDVDAFLAYPSIPMAPESWKSNGLESLGQYLSNSTFDDKDTINSMVSLPPDSTDHYAWLNTHTKPSVRHILPLPVPKWRRKDRKSAIQNNSLLGPSRIRAAKNCIASPDRAARMVLATLKADQSKPGESVISEIIDSTHLSVNDLAPHRDKIKKMKRTIGSDEVKSDMEERRPHISNGSRRRLRHQQRYTNNIHDFSTEQQQKLNEVRLPESAFDFSCPFQPRELDPLPTDAPPSTIGLVKCLKNIPIPFHSTTYNINRQLKPLTNQSDKQAISTTTVMPARQTQLFPPTGQKQKASFNSSRNDARGFDELPPTATSMTPKGTRPRRNKKSSQAARASGHGKDTNTTSRTVRATELLPSSSLLFDYGTSEEWMCWFCEFEVFVRGFVAARRRGGWYKRRRERNRRLREIEARQNNELISSSSSDLDEIDNPS